MSRRKDNGMIWGLVVGVAFFAWVRGATEEVSFEESHVVTQSEERLKAASEYEQTRRDLQTARERIQQLEQSLSTTTHELEELRHQNLSLQEERDMGQEDIKLMRAEMQRCTGDRAHLDDVMARYQMSQAQNFELQQRLRCAESAHPNYSTWTH